MEYLYECSLCILVWIYCLSIISLLFFLESELKLFSLDCAFVCNHKNMFILLSFYSLLISFHFFPFSFLLFYSLLTPQNHKFVCNHKNMFIFLSFCSLLISFHFFHFSFLLFYSFLTPQNHKLEEIKYREWFISN